MWNYIASESDNEEFLRKQEMQVKSLQIKHIKSTKKVWLIITLLDASISIPQPESGQVTFCIAIQNKIFLSGNGSKIIGKKYVCLKLNILRLRNDKNILRKVLKVGRIELYIYFLFLFALTENKRPLIYLKILTIFNILKQCIKHARIRVFSDAYFLV